MSCTYFEKLGFEGVILGGAVRDKKDLTNLTIPVICHQSYSYRYTRRLFLSVRLALNAPLSMPQSVVVI